MLSKTQDSIPPQAAGAALPTSGALALAHWGLLLAEGADAAAFLHGQLTQDIAQLGPDQARLGGYCSAKGRLLASFWAWKMPMEASVDEPPAIALACSADVLPGVLKRLSMFVLRAKCRLSDARGRLALWGLACPTEALIRGQEDAVARALGAASSASVGRVQRLGAASVVRLPDAQAMARWLWAAPPDQGPDQGPEGLPPLAAQAWDWLEVQSGVARVVAATADLFVPQMVNMELTGGVNFQKGCYPGQEVVARSQYRGTLKRRMYAAHADSTVAPGQEIFHDGDPGQPAGTVVLAAASPSGQGHDALVELKTALALAPGALSCGPARLQVGSLPYRLPAPES